jgi:hypothetical protein
MADLAAMMAARQTAVGGNTLNNKTKVWNCYTKYCKSIRLGKNIFLKGMSRWLCIKDDFLDHAMLPWCYENKVLWYLHTVLTYHSHVTSL